MYRDRPSKRHVRQYHLESSRRVVRADPRILTLPSVLAWSKIAMTMRDGLRRAGERQAVQLAGDPCRRRRQVRDAMTDVVDEMHVPVNKVNRVILKSQDVIHSFSFRSSDHRMPFPAEIRVWLDATKPE
jgi:heme/copper-type cytochrome/quinol oxidase subunit 2